MAQGFVPSAAALARTSTASFPDGLWRLDFAAGHGAPPLFYRPQNRGCAAQRPAMANDGGACIDSSDGNSWRAIFPAEGIDARQFGLSGAGDGTTAAQAALDAAFRLHLPGARVLFPTGFSFSRLAIYPNLAMVCGGDANPLVRTTPGPGIYTTDAPGNAYPKNPVFNVTLENCAVNDGNGQPGANLTIAEAQAYNLTNVHSYSRLAGTAFTGRVDDGALAVGSVTNGVVQAGEIGKGMLIECAGCGTRGNTYPRVMANGGSAGSYSLTAGTPKLEPRAMIGLVSWSWPEAPHSPVLPSAAILYLGDTYDGVMTNGYAGGPYNRAASDCAAYAGAGLILDTATADGTGKPNHNTFVQLYTPCANLGVAINNGADNTIVNADSQFDNYGYLIGAGAGNAWRNAIIQPYLEGGEGKKTMLVGIGFDRLGQYNYVIGGGSFGNVATRLVDLGGNKNNCWRNLGNDGSGVGQEYCSGAAYLTGDASFKAAPRDAAIAAAPGVAAAQRGLWIHATRAVASLPACDDAATGQIYLVSDAAASAFNTPVSGGGGNRVMVMCNGTRWVVF